MDNRKTIFIVEISTIRDGETWRSVRNFPTMEAAKAWAESVENERRHRLPWAYPREARIEVKKILAEASLKRKVIEGDGWKVTPAEDEVQIPGLSLFIKKPV